MSALGFILMCLFTVIGIKYLSDMIRYAIGYEVNGKCRFGKKYARMLEKKKRTAAENDEDTNNPDSEMHREITRIISTLSA